MRAKIWDAVIYSKAGATFMARLTGHDGELVTQASLTSVSYEVWDIHANPAEQEKAETALVVSTVIFDALQTDDRWTVDTVGFNFAAALPAADFDDDGDKVYQVEFKVTPAVGAVFRFAFRVDALRIYSAA